MLPNAHLTVDLSRAEESHSLSSKFLTDLWPGWCWEERLPGFCSEGGSQWQSVWPPGQIPPNCWAGGGGATAEDWQVGLASGWPGARPSSPGRRSRDGHLLPLHHTSLYLRQELEILRSSDSIRPSLININPSILEGNTNIRFRIIQICHDLKKFVNENIYKSIFIPNKAFLIFCGFNQLNRKSSNHLIVLKLYNIWNFNSKWHFTTFYFIQYL